LLEHLNLGCKVSVAIYPEDIKGATKIVIPGVGAFPAAIRRLESLGLKHALQDAEASDIPILGICLGMQLLFTYMDPAGNATDFL